MCRRRVTLLVCTFLVAAVGIGRANAAPDWKSLSPLKRVDADPKKRYWLTEDHGPWLILAATFSGPVGEKQAHQLALELRKDLGLPAYVHRQNYDYTETVEGLGVTSKGEPKKMRYLHGTKYDGFAVLVGDFQTVDDPRLTKVLDTVKYARPKCLEITGEQPVAQRMAVFREIQRRISPNEKQRNKGPMGSAFAARNPLLPEEFFAAKGPDPLVVSMNKDAEFSLLSCKGRYTVQVATFKGASTMKLKEIDALEDSQDVSDRLHQAGEKAHRLAAALRRKGVEAYEYHDRYQSIVTVGSFDVLGKDVPGGAIDLDPRILKIMQTYGAEQKQIPGLPTRGLQPKSLNGIAFDVQPQPIETPRVSIAAQYAPSNKATR